MARIRTLKPTFWTSEQIMELSRDARLLFVGMWNFCDDKGVHPASVKTLKAEVFPADDLLASDVQRLLDELIEQDLIGVFESDGRPWWFVTGWHHQLINRPSKSRYPEPPRCAPLPSAAGQGSDSGDESVPITPPIDDASLSTHGALTECSLTEGKGKEEERKGLKPSLSESESTAQPGVSQAGAICARLRFEAGIPSVNPQHPKLLALLSAGLTADEIIAAGMDANGKGFAWVLAAAEGRRRDADNVAALPKARDGPINGRRRTAAEEREAVSIALTGRKPNHERQTANTERDITGESTRIA